LEDREGNLWFATNGGGVSRYDGQNFVTITTKDGLASNFVTSILEDSKGKLWFGTYWGGVSRYDGQKFITFNKEDGLTDNRVTSIAEDKDGNIWFGTYWGGVSRYDGQSFTNLTAKDGLADNRITSILTDREGKIWFGTYSGGVNLYDGTSFSTFTIEDGLADNRVASILEDREGNLWFGTYSGVTRYDRGSIATYSMRDGLAHNDVRSIAKDGDGRLWFGTADGISQYDGIRFLTLTTEDGLAHNDVRSVLWDSKGNLWIGTYGKGASRYDGQGFMNFTKEDGLAGDDVWVISEDSKGNIWFGTYDGASRYDGSNFVTFTAKDGLAHNHVRSIIEDKEGNLWFGTISGASRYDGNSFVTFTAENGLPHNHVWSIIKDRENNLWFATRGGVSRYDGQSFQTITVKDGLPCKNVRSILEDKEGCLWFGTNGGGVCKYDGMSFQDFTTRDGLAHDTVRQIIQDKSGNLWFATSNQVTKYIPSLHKVKPRVRVTHAIVDEIYENPSNVESSSTRVTFEYRGLSFKTKFDGMKYIYRLEGKDTNWNRATHERRASYEDLMHGEYVFQVKAIDKDLNYSDAVQVNLKIIPDPRNYRIAQLEERILQHEREEMKRVYQELENARQIQMSLLPGKPPEIQGFEIAGISLPAKEVSGDFYDYLRLGEDIGIAMADVSGKSLKAAMVATMVNGMLHSEIKGQRDLWYSPGKILMELNFSLKPRLIGMMFTTMSLAILRSEEKRLLVSNAGMPYPIVKRGGKLWELEVAGFPLGIMNNAEYSELIVDLEAGDLVIFCSDGVIEAISESGELYRSKRLVETLQKADMNFSAQDMVDHILNDVRSFVGDTDPYDDITIVVLRCN